MIDVDPDGKAWNVVDGVARVRYAYQIEVNIASFPQWERNSTTGGNICDETTYMVARNAVHFGPERPAALILPVVPK